MSNQAVMEIIYYSDLTKSAVQELQAAESASELRAAWEDFLVNFTRALGKLISAGMSSEETKPFAHQLKQKSTRNDEGLVYLREARNIVEHGLSPCAEFRGPATHIGQGAFVLEGDSEVVFQNCTVNGVHISNAHVQTKEGKVHTATGLTGIVEVLEEPSSVVLVDLWNEEKRKEYPIPKSLDSFVLRYREPSDLAFRALGFLERSIKGFKDLSR